MTDTVVAGLLLIATNFSAATNTAGLVEVENVARHVVMRVDGADQVALPKPSCTAINHPSISEIEGVDFKCRT